MITYPSVVMSTRRAKWIWRQRLPLSAKGLAAVFGAGRSPADERNRFVYFRKALNLEATADFVWPLVLNDVLTRGKVGEVLPTIVATVKNMTKV